MKNIKRQLICIFIVVVMLTSIITIPCYAISSSDFIRAKSWIATAITALNITLSPLNYAGSYAVQNAVDPLGIVNTIQEQDYQYYMDRSTIKIYPDVVAIDGQLYSDIWLSYDAANKFRTEGLDFATAYSLASNSNGTYASGEGYVANVPMYEIDNILQSQYYDATFPTEIGVDNTYSIGDYIIQLNRTRFDARYLNYKARAYTDTINTFSGSGADYPANNATNLVLKEYNGAYYWHFYNPRSQGYTRFNTQSESYIINPFDFDYVSGTIPAEPLSQDHGLRIRVPSSHTNSSHPDRSYDITDYVNDNPDIVDYTFDFDPTTNPDYNLDIDLSNGLGDLLTAIILARLLDLIDDPNVVIDYSVDEPAPVVDETIAETKYSVLDRMLISIRDLLDAIKSTLDNILNTIHQELISIKNLLQSLYNTLSTIPTLLQTLFNDLADRILQDIEEGPIKLLDKLLDVLRTLFFPILATLKSFLGIWHYVVEWLSNISTPFTWIISIMAATSSVLMSPIYAFIAGIIVIAVYRRFGR